MTPSNEWLFDLAKAHPEPKAPVPRTTSPKTGTAPVLDSARRSPAQVLAALAFLKGLDQNQIQSILKICTIGSYEAAEEICAIDTPNDILYILISGELVFSTSEEGQDLTVHPVTTIGEFCFMTNCQRPAGLRAAKPSKVLCLSRSRFDNLPHDVQLRAYRNIIGILSQKMATCTKSKCKNLAKVWG